jgi:glutathione-regulated potassium-efflux system ancillary protein KefG
MASILIIFAHPALEKSRVHKRLVKKVQQMEGVTFHDLYEAYPDFDIDVKYEQQLLLRHDIIIFQHPFYWYSSPAIIKQWLDLVLEHGWAYGKRGTNLAGKRVFNAISAGGSKEAYCAEGNNKYTIRQLLSPFEQTARLCKMTYLPPYTITGTHKLEHPDIELFALQYEQLLVALKHERITQVECLSVDYLNELIPIPQTVQS